MSNDRFRRLRLFAIGALCATMIAPTLADTPPRLLDDNRGDDVLAAAESAAFNTAVILLGFPANPFVSPYLPIDVKGRVLGHPKIHNIYLDDDWDAHNPDAPTSAQIDAFTRALASSHYLDAAAQYGVHQAEFTGSHGRSILCAPIQPAFDHANGHDVRPPTSTAMRDQLRDSRRNNLVLAVDIFEHALTPRSVAGERAGVVARPVIGRETAAGIE